jgi:hypothetical protein
VSSPDAVESVLTTLLSIERLTAEQRDLIGQDDTSGLERNLDEKNRLIETLIGRSLEENAEAHAVLDRIVAAERENISLARTEMERLRAALKKTQEGLAAVRGYDVITSNVGATYIDTKN